MLIPFVRNCDLVRTLNYKITVMDYKNKGVIIGRNSILYDVKVSSSAKGDFFIIGDNCTLTGCTLLGHDASPSLFIPCLVNRPYPYLFGSRSSYRKEIKIGDNVFIGVGAIILPGINIGDNIIVSAGSVVTKNLASGYVYGGNPVKVIKSIDDYINKYNQLYLSNPEMF